MNDHDRDMAAIIEVSLYLLRTAFNQDSQDSEEAAREYVRAALELLQWQFDFLNGSKYQLSPSTAKMMDEFSTAVYQ
jgi:hypothetical protein